MDVRYEADGPVALITIDRPQTRNAIDGELAALLAEAFEQFDADPELSVAVLFGDGGNFCAGADIQALDNPLDPEGIGPLGPTRMMLHKPVIAINAATWWMALRDNGITDKVQGAGSLLREH